MAFEVVAHPIRANAWGMPAAPVAGSVVRARVGAKGATDIALAGRAFEVIDEDGTVVAAGAFGATAVPGSMGLYAAEVELPTRAEPGVAQWTLRIPDFSGPVPHAEGRHTFTLRTAAAPDRTVTVRAIDVATRVPVERAEAVLHPYRGTAASSGVATVQVAEGAYTLFVSAPGYEVFRVRVDVSDDLEIEAELTVVTEHDMNENYF